MESRKICAWRRRAVYSGGRLVIQLEVGTHDIRIVLLLTPETSYLASPGMHDIWPSFRKYLGTHFEWSPQVLGIVERTQSDLGMQSNRSTKYDGSYMAVHLRRGAHVTSYLIPSLLHSIQVTLRNTATGSDTNAPASQPGPPSLSSLNQPYLYHSTPTPPTPSSHTATPPSSAYSPPSQYKRATNHTCVESTSCTTAPSTTLSSTSNTTNSKQR